MEKMKTEMMVKATPKINLKETMAKTGLMKLIFNVINHLVIKIVNISVYPNIKFFQECFFNREKHT